MHPSLALDNLESLSPEHKSLAETALSGTTSHVKDFISRLAAMPKSDRSLFLPVLFALLDTVHIDLECLKSSTPPTVMDDRISAVMSVVPCLTHLINHNDVALEALDDIWRCAWAWIEFIQKFHASFDTTDGLRFYTKFIRFVVSTRQEARGHPNHERMISQTPGYLTFVGSAWTSLLRAKDIGGLVAVSVILTLEAEFRQEKSNDFRDRQVKSLVTGAGGSWDAFAVVLIEHIQLAIPSPASLVDKKSIALLGGVSQLLRDAVDHYPDLRACLATRGIIAVMVIACRALLEAHSSIPESLSYVADDFFVLLTGHIITPLSQTRVVEALRAGILPLIVAHARNPPMAERPEPIGGSLLFILTPILLELTVFHSVLTQLRISLEELGDIKPTVFAHPTVGKIWVPLVKLVRERLEVVKMYEAGQLTKLRACDNLECSAIREAGQIQRCSGCQSAYYCSQACQKVDYKSGKHREMCSTLRSRRDDYCAAVGDEDRAFLRALVNYEYDKLRAELAVGLVGVMSLHPQSTPYVVFDFSGGVCSISLEHSLKEEPAKQLDIELKPRENRDGRMEMHVVGIRAGRDIKSEDEMRWILMPLRSSSAQLHDSLRWLSQSITVTTVNVNVNEEELGREIDVDAYAGAVQQILALFPVTHTH
ncbi:hypothetical protein C8F01DRAFT_1174773 [Mycena amicta]|nr:hypothetical protein C8F01DRAFT_1174773 [Mycena amicta]